MCHGLSSFVFHCVVDKLIVNQQQLLRPLLFNLWDSSESAPFDSLLDRLSEHPDPQLPIVWLLRHMQSLVTVFETDGDR